MTRKLKTSLTLALAGLALAACAGPGYGPGYDRGYDRGYYEQPRNPNEVYWHGGPQYRSERGPGGYYYQQDGYGAGWTR